MGLGVKIDHHKRVRLLGSILVGLFKQLAGYLAFHLGHGLPGIWWGLAVSLFFVAVGVCIYLKRRGPALATRDLASASGA